MASRTIKPIITSTDNYIWCIHNANEAIIVDPGEAKPALEFIEKNQLDLKFILVTHRHADHTDGIPDILEHIHVPIYAANNVNNGDEIAFKNLITLKAIATPGHLIDHFCYYGDGNLFCGDLLFSAGCGRIFEGTYEEMFESLQKIKALPLETKIYPGHEYTLANLKFAQAVEPGNPDILKHIALCKQLQKENKPTLPSTLTLELKINPFLRTDQPGVIAAAEKKAGRALSSEAAVFEVLRKWKNNF